MISAPWLIWANKADLSKEVSPPAVRSTTGGGGGGHPGGGGGGAEPFLAHTKPVVWCCLTKDWSSESV